MILRKNLDIPMLLDQARRPGIYIVKMPPRSDAPGAPGCWFGGEPTLPVDIEWPSYFPISGMKDFMVPMQFLAQINLAALPRSGDFPNLPKTGTLFFFYDAITAFSADTSNSGYKVIFY
jgi:uncharacterized protein YwqG